MKLSDSVCGCILGTAVGDALGLPYEGLSARRGALLLGRPHRYRFFRRYGFVSDDTEHTLLVAQALIASGADPEAFSADFGWRLRLWLSTLPSGLGLSTLRAVLKLWCGFSAERSGVFSAGNGPAMRSALLGVVAHEIPTLRRLVALSTRITHTDPRAEFGAFAVAWAARTASTTLTVDGEKFVSEVEEILGGAATELTGLLRGAAESAMSGNPTSAFVKSLGLEDGVSGYIYDAVPVAIHAWLCHPESFLAAVESVIECGGDTDSTAAITGAIVGARVGKAGIPVSLLDNLKEWPRTVPWMESLAVQLARTTESCEREYPVRSIWLASTFRNIVFLAAILSHGIRRLFPPY